MPLYDFRCRGCGNTFEALVRSQDPEPRCPSCQGRDLEQLLSTFALDTDDRRSAAALDSRKRQVAKRKDAIIADEEYRLHHDD
ncbi:MAG TPA: zinc ribbon domain-containing protein [Vicinamibacterales bacterium]|nr:zinc ribbon domain-containing protein [Vicinamibacterales bacterium]